MPRVRLALQSSSGRVFDVGGIGENASVLEMSEVSSSLRKSRPWRLAEARPVFATAGESKGFIASLERHVSRSSCVGPAFAAVAPLASASSSPGSLASCVGGAVHARRTVSPMHGASNSGGTGGLLTVQRSTSYCLDNSWSDTVRSQGPRGRTGTKGGVSKNSFSTRSFWVLFQRKVFD